MTTYKSIKYNFDASNLTGVLSAPTVSGISPPSSTEAALPATITITGTNFQSNSTVTFVGASGTSILSPSVTFNSVTELEAAAPVGIGGQNEDPWDVKIENPVTGAVASSSVELLKVTLGAAILVPLAPIKLTVEFD